MPEASAYRVMVDFSPSFARPLYDRQATRSTQMELRALEAGSYYWKVAAGRHGRHRGELLGRCGGSRSPSRPRAPPRPPPLVFEAAELRGNVLQVRGRTEPGATLSLDGVRLEVQADGSFNEFVTFDGGAGAILSA